jgi:two-component system chemotaxis response regulator CheB
MRELLAHVLGSDPEIQLIGVASNGEEAIEGAHRLKPDVIAMDFHMPKMNGLDATRKIMETRPTPIVIVSGSSARNEVAAAFRVMESGALAIVEKPAGPGHPEYEAAARELVQTVKLMSEVKVVRRWAKRETGAPSPPPRAVTDLAPVRGEVKLVAIGASTGGPLVLKTILSALPQDFPVPILVVQHIAAGFTQGFAEWLAQSSGIAVHVATHREYLLPRHVYVAPEGFHLNLESSGRIALAADQPENGHRPSVSYLFRSVATVLGRGAIGVLLTGMGKDGAEELKLMKEKGAVTIAQDQESSVVHGMPGEAIGLDAATYVLSPDRIAEALGSLVGSTNRSV